MFRWFFPTVAAVVVGLLVLLGAFLPNTAFRSAGTVLLHGATVLGAFALVLAFGNLLRVHIGRLLTKRTQTDPKQRHRTASAILIASALASLVIVLTQGPEGQTTRFLMGAILIPGQSTLLALTAVTLVVAGMRLYRVRRHVNSVFFIVAALLALLTANSSGLPVALQAIVDLINSVATGGMRGLILGVAIGTIIAGLRVISSVDRPHSPRRTISR